MITIYHNGRRIVEVVLPAGETYALKKRASIAGGMLELAGQFPDCSLLWCHAGYKNILNTGLKDIFYHNKMMLSYTPGHDYLGRRIGYVEHLPFIRINKDVAYPTWRMGSTAGVIHSSMLLSLGNKIRPGRDLDYFLNSIGKICMPLGLLCYSEPGLLKSAPGKKQCQSSLYTLFRFVKQHYKTRWVFLLLLNLLVYEKQVALLPFFFSFFFRSRNKSGINLNQISIEDQQNGNEATVDVILPTIGRKQYLYDILCDLRNQTHLPENVIIVEQDPLPGSSTALGYLASEDWPFTISHTFTHQPGACNARNIALGKIESEWVFFADDDIRIKEDFIKEAMQGIMKIGAKAVSVNCLNNDENPSGNTIFQWSSFGSGSSIVHSKGMAKASFNLSFEFGYGEDSDFGMQLRNLGIDILYLPSPAILHLRAPVGGFRHKPVIAWEDEAIQPKPSPTIMLYHMLHYSREELLGYKTTLFFKYYTLQPIKNPVLYLKMFRKQWDKSVFWASQLHQQASAK